MQKLNEIFIGGKWRTPSSTKQLKVVCPRTQGTIATVPSCTSADVETAVRAASNALIEWKHAPAEYKKQHILAICEIMDKRKEELARVISESMGCPLDIARWLQVEDAIECMRLFAEHVWLREKTEKIAHSMIVREPIGVCAIINPWNFPLYQLVAKVGAGLAAGCTMVVKPSEQTPLQDFIFAEICQQANLPDGVLNIVTGTGEEVGSALSSHPEVAMVTFTGSTRAGAMVSKTAADTVKRVVLELGGKSPFLIAPDADLASAIDYGVSDLMLNSGQVCTSLSRMLVHESHYQAAQDLVIQKVNSLTVGPQDNADMGPLASHAHWQKVQSMISLGINEGATLICGGLGKPEGLEQGFYTKPTVFVDVDNQMQIAQNEIFGPVLCMIPYANIDQAIEIANDTPYGLNSAVYAKDIDTALSLAKRIESGLCHINGAPLNFQAPFGGFKASGNGRELSQIGVEEFLEIKSIQLPQTS